MVKTKHLAAATLLAAGLAHAGEKVVSLDVNPPYGHTERITGGAFLSPRLVATCSKDATVIVWDVDTGSPLRRIFLPDQCFGMTHLPGSGHLRVDCGTVRRGGQRVMVDPISGTVDMNASKAASLEDVSPNGAALEIARKLLLGEKASMTAREENRILVGYEDGKAELWSTKTGRPVIVQRFQSHLAPITAVASGGEWVAMWNFLTDRKSHHLQFWNPGSLRVITAEPGDATSIVSGVFLNAGEVFVSCEDSRYNWRWKLVAREVASGRIIAAAETPKGMSATLSVNPGDDRIVLTHYGLTGPGVYVWRFRDGALQRIHDFPRISAENAVLDPARRSLYSEDFANRGVLCEVHNIATGRRTGTINNIATEHRTGPIDKESPEFFGEIFGTVVGMRLLPETDILLTSTFHRSIGYCAITDLGTGRSQVMEFRGIHSAFARAGGRQVLLGGTSGNLYLSLLNRNTGKTLAHWEYPQSNHYREHLVSAYGWTNKKDAVALSDDEETVYLAEPTGAVRMLRISDRNALEEVGRLIPLTDGDWAIVTPDGNYASSPGGATKMAFSRGQQTFPFEQFDLTFNRPDLVVERLGAPVKLVSDLRKALAERHLKYRGKTEAKPSPPNAEASVTIRNRRELGMATREPALRLDLDVFGAGQGATVAVSANGVEKARHEVPSGSTSIPVVVPLSRGVNRVEAAITLADGSRTLPVTLRIHHEPRSAPDLYLLAIGVSDYTFDHLDLSLASKDARDVASYFGSQEGTAYRRVHSRLILDSAATSETILAAADFFAETRPEDTAIVFLAGHGMLEAGSFEYYFGTTDIDPDDVSRRGVPYSKIERLFSRCRSGNRLILMDTCFAGEVETFDLARPEAVRERVAESVSVRATALAEAPVRKLDSMARLRRELFADLRRSSGANVITASGGMEFVFAGEDQDLGNGLFTHCFLTALKSGDSDRDGDGSVTVSELSGYLKSELTKLSGGAQLPAFREVNRYSNFRIGRCRPFPKLDGSDFVREMLWLTTRNNAEDRYAALFSSPCNYFGELKSRSEIARAERAYHEKYDEREIRLISQPIVSPLGEGVYAVTYKAEIILLNSREAGNTGVAVYDSPSLIEQKLRLQLRFETGKWQISSIEVLASKRKPNPSYKPSILR